MVIARNFTNAPSASSAKAVTPKELPCSKAEPEDQFEIKRQEIPGSYIVAVPTQTLASLVSSNRVQVEKVIGHANDSTYLLVSQPESTLQDDETFTQVFPNYQYSGKLYDDPVQQQPLMSAVALTKRPGHLDIINIDPAWEQTKGSPENFGAVTDTGLDVAHPVLQGTVWHNAEETANGKDDDGNGYVDDLSGWDFTDADNDASHTRSTHHTHVHGIVHANEGDSGATGVAPGSQSMPLRIAGGKLGYSSAILVESYLYAMNQGAKSINTSFNIDGFVGDKAIESTYRTLVDNDVLLFNSAGNSGRKNPARSKFEDIVLVASTDTAAGRVDKRSSFSNYGNGVDIAAPGSDIISTFPNGRVGASSGTSMASPVAMGVDLLVQSAHPDWNAAQRWAQIAGTADNINELNPNEAGLFGGGRVNAGRALTETLSPPTLSARETKAPNGSTSKVTVRFEKVFDPATSNQPEAWKVVNSQGDTVMQGAPKEVRLLTNEIEFNVGSLPAGAYSLVGSAEHLRDPFGRALDGDGDGVGGDNFVKAFEILPKT